MTNSPINYLKNPSFESHLKSWGFWYAEPSITNPHDKSPGARFQKPEVDVLSHNDLPAEEHKLFILDGDHTLKIAKYSGAWSISLRQIADLPQGRYTLKVNIFGDLIKGYTDAGEKIWGDDPQGRDGLTRFVVGDLIKSYDRDKKRCGDDPQGRDGLMRFVIEENRGTWHSLTPGDWNSKSLTFKANGLTLIHVDIMCPFPLRNSGVFCDNWSLTRNPDTYIHVYTVIPQSYTMQQATEVFRKAWADLQ